MMRLNAPKKFSTSVGAAALQNDIASRLNLPGAQKIGANLNKTKGNNKTSCASCSHSHDATHATDVCHECGYFINDRFQPIITMAQMVGLETAHENVDAIRTSQWCVIEDNARERDAEAFCPICMIAFKNGSEVLLSCSHIFHRICIKSFEEFTSGKGRYCPLCRCANYQKKLTNIGSLAFKKVAVVRIQQLYRGYCVRKKYVSSLRAFYRRGNGEKLLRKKFYEKELSSYRKQISEQVDSKDTELDLMFSSIDDALKESKQLDDEFDRVLGHRAMVTADDLSPSSPRRRQSDQSDETVHDDYPKTTPYETVKTDWTGSCFCQCNFTLDESYILITCMYHILHVLAVLQIAVERGFQECGICLSSLLPPITSYPSAGHSEYTNLLCGGREVVLLDCAHSFHRQCIDSFERFSHGFDKATSCPLCRSAYEKKYITASEVDLIARGNQKS